MLALGGILAACAPDPPARELELSEALALELPTREPVAGLVATDAGAVAAWAGGRLFWAASGSGRLLAEIGGPGHPVAAAFVEGDSLLEVVDASGEVVTLRVGGGRVAHTSFRPPVPIQAAVRTPGGWVGGGTDRVGRYLIFPLQPGRDRVLLAFDPDTLVGLGAAAVQLSPAGEDVLVTDLEPPFRTRRMRPDGSVAREFQPRHPPPDEPVDTLRGEVRWISLPVVPLQRGYLQTLTDLGSDRRLIVLYDGRGREVRRREVEVPVGITGITPRERYLLASRNAGRPEVLLYSWRWNTP